MSTSMDFFPLNFSLEVVVCRIIVSKYESNVGGNLLRTTISLSAALRSLLLLGEQCGLSRHDGESLCNGFGYRGHLRTGWDDGV
jgi:hypothetical protein